MIHVSCGCGVRTQVVGGSGWIAPTNNARAFIEGTATFVHWTFRTVFTHVRVGVALIAEIKAHLLL